MGSTRFSWRYLAFLAVQLSIIFHKVSGKGLFQLRLLSFTNELALDINGNCCDGSPYRTDRQCSTLCRTYFKICLFNFVQHIDTEPFPKCTYGNSTTKILGNNTFEIPTNDSEGLIQLPFDYAWPNDFSLIVDALHTNMTNSRNTAQVESNSKLIARLATQRHQNVSPTWFNDTYSTETHTLRYSYRVICDVDYYGDQCKKKCEGRDDFIGHYTCLSDGSRQCLPGWTGGFNCQQPVCSGCVNGICSAPDSCDCNAGYMGDHCDECETKIGCEHGTCDVPTNYRVCFTVPGKKSSKDATCAEDTNYCTKHTPCLNGGTCRNEGSLGYLCYCAEGFTGVDCEEPAIAPRCMNGGTPVITPTTSACICPPETTGPRCQLYVPTCQSSDVCFNGGTCIDTLKAFFVSAPVVSQVQAAGLQIIVLVFRVKMGEPA
ncbi:delta protein [Apostichopus japonicus]|uniref:Delta-like protein n=1 Tax=Stichopus japonicus TaxID=307972 RepID=A0A2G8L3B6_STIJA|nr:delta protein [Apostichopus japonicus]